MAYGLKNNTTSKLTAGISSSATSVSITTGEGQLFINNSIATLEHKDSDGNVVKREIVLISNISGDTLTITRAYGPCVIDDTAEEKQMSATAQSFSEGDSISIYLASEVIQDLYSPVSEIDALCCCICECHDTRKQQVLNKIQQIYGDYSRGSGCDGDCVISGSGTKTLLASREYFFRNLTICAGVCLRFEGKGVPKIHVCGKFCNMGTIDLMGGCFVGACSFTNCLGTITNRYNSTCYNAMCFGCGGSGGTAPHSTLTNGAKGGNGGNANVSGGSIVVGTGGAGGCSCCVIACTCGKDGGNGGPTCGGGGGGSGGLPTCTSTNYTNGVAGNNGSSRNGGNGGTFCCLWKTSCVIAGVGGGGGGGGYRTGNGGNGGTTRITCCDGTDKYGGAKGGDGGNGGIWGKGGNGGDGLTYKMAANSNKCGYLYGGFGGNGGNGFYGGNGGCGCTHIRITSPLSYCCMCGGNGGNGIGCGGVGGNAILCSASSGGCKYNINMYAGNGGNAIQNMYAFALRAKCFYNGGTIDGKGGNGGNGGNIVMNCEMSCSSCVRKTGNGGNGSSGACIMIVYNCNLNRGTITCAGGCGGTAGTATGTATCTLGTNGSNGSTGILRFCCRERVPA